MTDKPLIAFILVYLAGWASCDSRIVEVIVGSTLDAFCPLRGGWHFEVPSEKDGAQLDVSRGHLRIPEVRLRHAGSIFCSNGRQRILSKRVKVVQDPGHYKVDMITPSPVFRGGPLKLECCLSIPVAESKAYVRFLLDGKPIPGEFTNSRADVPLRRLFWLDRNITTKADAGRTVQCEVRVPFDEPCCPRSKKMKLKVEEPLQCEMDVKHVTIEEGETATVPFAVKHWHRLDRSAISVTNVRNKKVRTTKLTVRRISRHRSILSMTFKPEESGTYYIGLNKKLSVRCNPFSISFKSEKNALEWMVAFIFAVVIMAIAVVCLCFYQQCTKETNSNGQQLTQHEMKAPLNESSASNESSSA